MMKNGTKIKVYIDPQKAACTIARQNISQSELALKIGIGVSYLNQILSADYPASPKVRVKLLEVLGCDWSDIFLIKELPNKQ